jgi:hypothetical protein
MKTIWSSVRVLALVLAVVSAVAASVTGAHAHPTRYAGYGDLSRPAGNCSGQFCDQKTGAQRLNDPGLENGTFPGQITALIGPASNPSGLILQLGTDSIDIRLSAKTMISGKSAEADVEGLVRGDYAVVRAKRVNRVWFATRITFDVQPIAPLRLVSGMILHVNADGRHFTLRPDVGKGTYFMRVIRQTRFTMDMRPGDAPTMLIKGAVVQILCRKIDGLWTAYTINLRSST